VIRAAAFLVTLAAGLSLCATGSAARFKDVGRVSDEIRTCMSKMGASSVQAGPNGSGVANVGGSHLAWGWVNVGGSAKVTLRAVDGVYGLGTPYQANMHTSSAAQRAARTCLLPFAPPRSWYHPA
jgi:hypothetical protein